MKNKCYLHLHRRCQSTLCGFAFVWSGVLRLEEERVLENSLILTWSPAYSSWHAHCGMQFKTCVYCVCCFFLMSTCHYLWVTCSSRSISSTWLSINLLYGLFHVPSQALLHHQFTVLSLAPWLHYIPVPQERGMSCPSWYNQGWLSNWSWVSTHTRLLGFALIQVLVWCLWLKTLSILDSHSTNNRTLW